MIELKRFEFVTTLGLEFKKIDSDDKAKYNTFYLNLKEKNKKTTLNETGVDNISGSI